MAESSPTKSFITSSTGAEVPTLSVAMSSPNSDSPTQLKRSDSETSSHVDIAKAKNEFDSLEKQLHAGLSLNSSLPTLEAGLKDLEKGEGAMEKFDLREYLSITNNANLAAGIKHKHVGVTWSKLQISTLDNVAKAYVRNLPQVVWGTLTYPLQVPLNLIRCFTSNTAMATKTVLYECSGILKPGEMCLVLGLPGSGCTSFLKTITNNRGGFASVSGDVLYAGITHEEMAKRFKGEVLYNGEDDIHIPTLTVEQTMEFALSTKTPGKRVPGKTSKQFNQEVMATLLKMLAMGHTRDTLVGDAFVRGVSGGERKRISILEMMATRAHVVAYDNSTRGLDASTALDFIKALRVTTDILGQTTFLSLYQAGENVYNLFDKVLLLQEGRAVYFGPAEEARSYFISLGYQDHAGQTTSDFLTSRTDPNERHRMSKHVPTTAQELESVFKSSEISSRMDRERQDFEHRMRNEHTHQEEFRNAVLDSKKKGTSDKSPYTIGFWGQVRALTTRQMRLQAQDQFTLWATFCTSTICALVLGGTFFNLPTDTFGGFTRGSILFMALLTTCLDALGEMPTQMIGRPVFLKQVGYTFFRPAALSVANTIADIPFSAVRVLVFNIIIYFMSNLHRSGGGFWTFHILIYLSYLSLQGFFRTIGAACGSFDTAFRLGVFLSTHIISYGGYTIPYDSMKEWVAWIYYLNPLSYAFSGLLSNEFGHTDMLCNGNYIVPRNRPGETIYPTGLGSNQVCTFFGARPGEPVVLGEDYLKASFNINPQDLWRRNFLVLLGMFLFFQLTQALALEKASHGAAEGPQVFVKTNKAIKVLNDKLKPRQDLSREKSIEKTSGNGRTLTWKNVNYTVPVADGNRDLLHNATGYLKPGSLTALLGASGAGKTTALDVFAQRKTLGVVTGEIYLDGKPLPASFSRKTAYAEQMDVHEGTTTVREAMRFSAYLRQPLSVPKDDKNNYVESLIVLLELQDLADALVQTLSLEARKRLTIAVELAAKPDSMLFLDEPTSGLDSQSALSLVRFLKRLSSSGLAILCTIHQPSVVLFQEFDRVLLLESGGETVYFGDIGTDSQSLRNYLAQNGAMCPNDANPAEFALQAIGVGNTVSMGLSSWKDFWQASPEFVQIKKDIEEIESLGATRPAEPEDRSKYATPFWTQLVTVTKRTSIALWRNPEYLWTRMFIHIALSLSLSLAYFQLGHSIRSIQFRSFAIFGVTIIPGLVMNHIEPAFLFNRQTFVRESSSRMYSPTVFALSQLIAEIPYALVCAVLYWVLMYFPQGLGKGAGGVSDGAWYYLLLIFVVVLFGISLGQAVAALSPNMKIALLFPSPFTLILTNFAGVTIPYPYLPKFWRVWMYELNPYTRIIAGLVSTELKGLKIRCNPDEFAIFDPPTGQTCQLWAGKFVDNFGGYLQDPSATSSCHYCQYKVGEEYYTPLNISYDNRGRDLGILFAFVVFNVIVTVLASNYLRFTKR